MRKIKRSKLPWFIGLCNTGEKCWCRIIVNKKGSDDMKHCVVPAGSITKADAEFIVDLVNRYGGKK